MAVNMKMWQKLTYKGAMYIGYLDLFCCIILISARDYLQSFIMFLLFICFVSISYCSFNRFKDEPDIKRLEKHDLQ